MVELNQTAACDSCSIHNLCGKAKNSVQHKIKTEMNLETGDLVKVYISSGTKLLSSFVVFIFPIILMITAYLITKFLSHNENLSILMSIFSLIPSGLFIYLFDKKFAQKLHFEIVEKIFNSEQ